MLSGKSCYTSDGTSNHTKSGDPGTVISYKLGPYERNFAPGDQGCQMVYFQNPNRNLGKFSRTLEWKRLVNSLVILPFGIYYGHLVHFAPFWYTVYLVYITYFCIFYGHLVYCDHLVYFTAIWYIVW
jgi:hypothetical protein